MGRPRTKNAQKTWLMMQELRKAGYQIPSRTARCATRPRLWIRYTVAIDLLSQAIGLSPEATAKAVEYRLARFDHGLQRFPLRIPTNRLGGPLDKPAAVCPCCGSQLDLETGTWTPGEMLDPLDLDPSPNADDAQDNPQVSQDSCS